MAVAGFWLDLTHEGPILESPSMECEYKDAETLLGWPKSSFRFSICSYKKTCISTVAQYIFVSPKIHMLKPNPLKIVSGDRAFGR